MDKPLQPRALATRAKLINAAETLVETGGFEALRVEEVVAGAGVAKGTFFAHFRDKDALMERLIGARFEELLRQMNESDTPRDVPQLVAAHLPLMRFMTCERYVFDLILRYSGAALIERIGPIAQCIGQHEALLQRWIAQGAYRTDAPLRLLAEGVQAFVIQTLALTFCALHTDMAMQRRLETYVQAWLLPAA
ncbi:TetR/AcrR family transcriptional regulator [Sulfitobacter sp. S190]|uniref:TetR/AcrR family transcriptional regulator n=1 Tax=Sulfitobacter sp. S190 TaxID=2867022 RepID=UPI0021A68072|nr:TetR/AcrR family transcriptional regulator [Sulfitobacter sp. S190]UWR22797.1 TetR/AcrR family transcriptional regulator [Sulfitobacter sp. S190]